MVFAVNGNYMANFLHQLGTCLFADGGNSGFAGLPVTNVKPDLDKLMVVNGLFNLI